MVQECHQKLSVNREKWHQSATQGMYYILRKGKGNADLYNTYSETPLTRSDMR